MIVKMNQPYKATLLPYALPPSLPTWGDLEGWILHRFGLALFFLCLLPFLFSLLYFLFVENN